jgi:lambda family phage portal protein
MNPFEKAIAAISPRWAVSRAHSRKILSYFEAATPGQTRKARREPGSGNVALQRAGTSLREQARHLEQNHDIAAGAMDALVNNTIGPGGIGIEPQPRNLDGSIHEGMALQLSELWRDWQKFPEVTWQHDWASCQRLLARSWYRDGEAFNQVIEGISPYLDHGTKVPLSLEMLEADYVPLHLMSSNSGLIQGISNSGTIVQGVEINAWGRPVAYWVYKEHPADFPVLLSSTVIKRIPANNMQHIATRSRIRQLRGVTRFATVLARLDDLKDYEESERVAAKVAASMAAFIKKGAPDDYVVDDNAPQRNMKFRPGMVFDDLKPGEEIGTIDTNRPNPNLETYRSGQLRAAAGGIGLTYSTLAKNYNGTYSSQRQELVEGYSAYGILSSEFGARIVRPTYERFVAMAIAARLIKLPADLDQNTLSACLLIPPQMPWIDPEKEANANAIMEDRCYTSGPEIIRRRGGTPSDVLAQQAQWLKQKAAQGLQEVTSAEPAKDNQPTRS